MTTLLFIAASVFPAATILAWTWRRDRLPEPPRVVLATFTLGALATVPILAVEIGVSRIIGIDDGPRTVVDALLLAFVVAALVEELFKFAVLSRYSARHSAFDEPYDGIVYGVAASLGFACVENLMYVMSAATRSAADGTVVALSRALMAVPLHTACGAIMGVCMGVAKARHGAASRRWPLLGLGAAIVVHGLYDAVLFVPEELPADDFPAAGLVGLLAAAMITAGSWAASAAAASWLRRHQHAR